MAAIATRREDMTPGAQNFLNDLDEFLGDVLEIDTDSDLLTGEVRDGRSDSTSFAYILRKLDERTPPQPEIDPYDQSVKFDSNREIVEATDERLINLLDFQEQSQKEEPLEGNHIDQDRLYRKQLEFVAQLVEWNVIAPFEE